MPHSILLVKEDRAGEKRVALVPSDVKALVERGHTLYFEHDAGIGAGFSNEAYLNAGARCRHLAALSKSDMASLFEGIDMVVRVKRPSRSREIIENTVLPAGCIMVGALDILELQSPHINEYKKAKINPVSLDQLPLSEDSPMNILSSMSKIAGKLAMQDAINKNNGVTHHVVVIGFGIAGQSAAQYAVDQGINTSIIASERHLRAIKRLGAQAKIMNTAACLSEQQAIVREAVERVDVVICSARRTNTPAPLLIPLATLDSMQTGSVIVDLALSEGGNVQGSEHDKTLILGNGIIITNTSGYPKSQPLEASILWSRAVRAYIEQAIRLSGPMCSWTIVAL